MCFSERLFKEPAILKPQKDNAKVIKPITKDGNNIGTPKNFIETPAPKASMLVANARVNMQTGEIQEILACSSLLNASFKNLIPNNKKTTKTIHFEYFSK